MVYPKLPNKHLHEAFWHPKDFKKEERPKKFPKKFIFIYYDKLFKYLKRKYKLTKIFYHDLFTVYRYRDIGIILMGGIGCPHAVAVMESLIAKGANTFLSIGTAGGLQKRGIFLCDKALRDEGTSYHYISHGHYSYPDEKLTKRLGKFIEKQELGYNVGSTWTIDAPYRETLKEIRKYSKEGIKTVEMEASALFAVAKIRKAKVASAFVVSDTLFEKERVSLMEDIDFKKALNKLADAAVECLR
jgi:uridine phosphorylase